MSNRQIKLTELLFYGDINNRFVVKNLVQGF